MPENNKMLVFYFRLFLLVHITYDLKTVRIMLCAPLLTHYCVVQVPRDLCIIFCGKETKA